jgi:hypothetical protein
MTYSRNLLFLLLSGCLLFSCERDDICSTDTSTTPRLLIEFTDVLSDNQDEPKNVPNLTIYGEGLTEDPVSVNSKTLSFNASINSIELPLVIGTEGETVSSRFIMERRTDLRLDENEDTNSNIDIIEISYVPEFRYVSRACGFKAVFTNLSITIVPDDNNWIIDSQFPNNDINTELITVENENSTHAFLLH